MVLIAALQSLHWHRFVSRLKLESAESIFLGRYLDGTWTKVPARTSSMQSNGQPYRTVQRAPYLFGDGILIFRVAP